MINGQMIVDAIISASNNINNFRTDVDALNVFPVPDGDTGTNMSMTIGAAAREVRHLPAESTVSEVLDKTASALLRGARGNSGVILSLIFRGIAKGAKGASAFTSEVIVNALKSGRESAYGAVMKPTEGTILTVIRETSEKISEDFEKDSSISPEEMWTRVCQYADESLAKTPEILPVLKTAGVVDAGGKGLLCIFEGMKSVFCDGKVIELAGDSAKPVEVAVRATSEENVDIKFCYCTEFIVDKMKGLKEGSAIKMRAYLESIGDCVVVVEDEEIVKVHVHTNEPGNAIQAGLKLGSLMNIKIENMRLQHANAEWGAGDDVEDEGDVPLAEPEKKYGFVAVAAGEGVIELFKEIGVDNIVSGGQTMNPSTADLLKAVNATASEHVYILPNNKNIIMAAEQVVPLTSKKVHVLRTKTIPQGITAMLNFDESLRSKENLDNMMVAANKVQTGQVTFAARDSVVDGKAVKQGEILGLENGKITEIEHSPVKAGYRITKSLIKKIDASMVTIIYGEDSSEEEANELEAMISAKFAGKVDVSVLNGGQPVYSFVISVE